MTKLRKTNEQKLSFTRTVKIALHIIFEILERACMSPLLTFAELAAFSTWASEVFFPVGELGFFF